MSTELRPYVDIPKSADIHDVHAEVRQGLETFLLRHDMEGFKRALVTLDAYLHPGKDVQLRVTGLPKAQELFDSLSQIRSGVVVETSLSGGEVIETRLKKYDSIPSLTADIDREGRNYEPSEDGPSIRFDGTGIYVHDVNGRNEVICTITI